MTISIDAANDLFPRIGTGNAQADLVLGGGLPAGSINIVMGQPGTGKTVFAEQLLFSNASPGRPMVYVSTLSEPIAGQPTAVIDAAFAMVMLLLSLLPLWFVSPANVAVAVQPLTLVTLVQSPL